MIDPETVDKIKALVKSGDEEAIQLFLQSEEAAEFKKTIENAWDAIKRMLAVYAEVVSSFVNENKDFLKYIATLNEKADFGTCETCEKENTKLLYSVILGKWQCEGCDDLSADDMWYGDND